MFIPLIDRIILRRGGSPSDPGIRRKYGLAASLVGIAVNLLLFGGKFVAGLAAGAISVTADAINNLTDAGSQIISLISFRMSAKPPDREHPFGHARIEYVASMIISFLILIVGYELFRDSVKKLISPEPPDRGVWVLTVLVLVVSILFKLWLWRFGRRLGKKINSSVLRAGAADSLSDVLATGSVLAGFILYLVFGWTWVDAAVGLGVSVVIFFAGFKILNETKNLILGEPPSDTLVGDIRGIVGEYPAVLGVHDMVIHNYGPGRIIASLHAEVDGKTDIFELHDIIDRIERRLGSELSITATIHMDPILTDCGEADRLRKLAEIEVKDVDGRLEIHDFRCLMGKDGINLVFDISVPFEFHRSNDELVRTISERIKAINPKFGTIITIDRE